MKKRLLLSLTLPLAFACNVASAGVFTNGGFEDGTASGWTTGQGYRGNTLNSALTTSSLLPGGSLYSGPATSRSSIISAGSVDPLLGSLIGSIVYNGSYSYRAEDTNSGGYASVISQSVTNYADANIFFAWKAVLENGGHSEDESAEMLITLTDDTTHTLLISRVYNAGNGGGGVDSRFSQSGDYFYTANWQIEQLTIDPSLAGHNFTLSLLAADCNPTAHTGYVYLDGFSSVVVPPGEVPEPASLTLLGLGAFCAYAGKRRRASAKRKNAMR